MAIRTSFQFEDEYTTIERGSRFQSRNRGKADRSRHRRKADAGPGLAFRTV